MRVGRMLASKNISPVTLALLGIFSAAQAQGILQCPYGYAISRFQYDEPFDIHAGLNRIVVAGSVSECIDMCTSDESCVVAIFDPDGGRCVHGFVNATNLDFVCAEFRNTASFRSQKIGELSCSTGCSAIEKICNQCGNTGLNKLIALTFCSQGTFASMKEACEGDPRRNILSTLTVTVPLNSGERNDLENGNRIDYEEIREGEDSEELCCFWASNGECDSNPFWMKTHCQLSCGTFDCHLRNALNCEVKLAEGCELRPDLEIPTTRKIPAPDSSGCSDMNDMCSFWAYSGECQNNIVYMTFHCPASCGVC